jgi:hypothetical protein
MTHRISELASKCNANVLFLGLFSDAGHELSLRRELATLSALLAGSGVSAEVKVEFGTNWMDIVRENYQAGDMIVCLAEQHVGLLHRPLSQILKSRFRGPVYIFSNLYPKNHNQSNWLSQIIAWTGFLGIIAGTFLLQVQILSMPGNWAQTTLLILTVIAEFWLIWIWNGWFG